MVVEAVNVPLNYVIERIVSAKVFAHTMHSISSTDWTDGKSL